MNDPLLWEAIETFTVRPAIAAAKIAYHCLIAAAAGRIMGFW